MADVRYQTMKEIFKSLILFMILKMTGGILRKF